MKQSVFLVVASSIALFVLLYSGVMKAVAFFVLFGLVPGTNIVLSTFAMACIIISATAVTLIIGARTVRTAALQYASFLQAQINPRKRLPQYRYGRQLFTRLARRAEQSPQTTA